MPTRTEVEIIVAILKKKFNNLGAEELIKLAFDILEAVGK
jgi:hypothetical protein